MPDLLFIRSENIISLKNWRVIDLSSERLDAKGDKFCPRREVPPQPHLYVVTYGLRLSGSLKTQVLTVKYE